ncbi:MAG: asparagine synthase (glutamine-hydrolyzing) [Nitrospiraceae bacterium]|nr:asparagine synthase (glutamine-hydrolyzing) [Nitrospiraceae bacterium]
MCGICGIYAFDGSKTDNGLLALMMASIEHRGPDGDGRYIANGIALGHRRLSIIDAEGGSQPISNEDSGIQVVFNGEIYNYIELRQELAARGHIFKTLSDTEVIVHGYEEWGLDCVSKFNGIFSIALWDSGLKRLFLARDHLGVKPLYYSQHSNKLFFASEIKALLQDPACPRHVDITSLEALFTLRYVPSPKTLFSGIFKLPAGHMMVVDPRGIDIRRYWQWKPQVRAVRSEPELIEQYQCLLEDTVKLQMRSDVPVGLFLSSGIDSGVLLALMSKLTTQPIQTFTIGFEDGEKTNETADAREIAGRFGADHTEMVITAGDYEKYYERYMWDLEEPVGNESAAAFYFVSLLAGRKVKVVLTGQGADEPWAGYDRYLGVKFSGLYSRLPSFITGMVLKKIILSLPRSEKLKRGAIALAERDVFTRFIKIYSFYSAEMRAALFKPWVKDEIKKTGSIHSGGEALYSLQSDVALLDPLTQMLYIDTRANLPDDLLMVGDKTSMANSLEARVPFLDHYLVEFIETLPPGLKLHGLQGKYLHKKALEKWLPKDMIYRKKKGFANPVNKWLRGKMQGYVNEALFSNNSAVSKYFNRDYIARLVRLHESNKEEYMRHIYLLLSFELWHEKFIRG